VGGYVLLELVGKKRVEKDVLVEHGEEILGKRKSVVGQVAPQVREQTLAHHRTHDAQVTGAQERPTEPNELSSQDCSTFTTTTTSTRSAR
jgi:hypothetical protein